MLRKSSRCKVAKTAVLTAAGLFAGIPQAAQAANSNWTSTSAGNWSNSGNWANGVPGSTTVLTSTDIATFNLTAGVVVTVDSTSQNIGGINFSSAATTGYTISGNPLYLTAGQNTSNLVTTAITETISSPIVLEGNYNFSSNATVSNLALSGNISGGAYELFKYGSGTLTLSGTNTYAGGTNISGGALTFSSTSALPATGLVYIGSTSSTVGPAAQGALNLTGAFNNSVGSAMASGYISNFSTGAVALSANSSENINFATLGYNYLELGAMQGTTVTYSGVIGVGNSGYHLGGGLGTLIVTNPLALANGLTISQGTVILAGNDTNTLQTLVNGAPQVFITGNDNSPGGFFQSNTSLVGAAVINSLVDIDNGGLVNDGSGAITLNTINQTQTPPATIMAVGGSAVNSGTLISSGSVLVERNAGINISAGGLWVQTGSSAFILGPNLTSTSSNSAVYVAGVFNDQETVPFNFAGTSSASAGAGILNVSGGVFITTQGFNYSTAAVGGAVNSGLILSAGGTLSLGASIPLLTQGNTVGIFQSPNGVIDTNGYNTTVNRPISNASATGGNFAVTGYGGTVTLGATNTYTGATNISQGAILSLGNGTNLINTASTLQGSGGTLSMSGAGTQTFAGTQILAGGTTISIGSGNTLTLGVMNRSTGGTVDFGTLPTSPAVINATVANTNGIIGGWATVGGGANWAVNSGSGVIAAYSNSGANYNTSTLAGTTPANYASMNIDINSSPTFSSAITPNTLRFNSASPNTVTLAGTNTISGGILVTPSVGANAQVITGGTLTATGSDLIINQYNNVGGGGLTIGSVIANSSSGTATGLTTTGPGTITLSGANTYTGVTNVNAGTLIVSNFASGQDNGAYVVAAGATLDIGFSNYGGTGPTGAYEPGITVNGSGLSNSAGLNFAGGITFDLNYGINVLTAPTNIGTYGTGIATLEGYDVTSSNYITTSALASGTTISANINLLTSHTNGFSISTTAGANNSTGDLVINGAITGTGSYSISSLGFASGFNKFGNGSVLLTGASNYSSGTNIADGQVILSGGNNRLPVTTVVELGGQTGNFSLLSTSTSAGQLLLNGVSQQLSGIQTLGLASNNSVLGDSTTLSTLVLTNAAPLTFSGYLGGGGTNNNNLSLNLSSPSTLTLSSPNSYTGGTVISIGTLIPGVSSIGSTSGALGQASSAVTLGDANTGSNIPTLQVSSGITVSNSIISNVPTATVTATGSSGQSILLGAITLNQNITFNNSNSFVSPTVTGGNFSAGGMVVEGNITGTGGITYTGGEVFVTTVGAATYFGQTLVTGNSVLQYNSSVSTDANSVMNISAGSTVFLEALTSAKFGGLIGAGTLQATNQNGASLTIGALNDTSDIFSGVITGPFTLTKTGTGTQILSGTNNYTGITIVNAGTLTATGSSALGAITNQLTVNNNNNSSAGTNVVLNLSTTSPTTTGTLSGVILTPTSGVNTATINNGGQLLTVNATATASFAGAINGSGGLVYSGYVYNSSAPVATAYTGKILTMSGTNTYTGLTNVAGGTLNLTGNDSAMSGGFLISNNIQYLTDTLTINSGAVVDSTNPIIVNNTIGNASNATITVGGPGNAIINNSGLFDVYRTGIVTIAAGSTWNQSGSLAISPNVSTGYNTTFTVAGSFNYSGGTLINLSPAPGGNGQAQLIINGPSAAFTTNAGFQDTSVTSGGSANLNLSNGATLALSANVPALTTTSGSAFNFVVGTGGGVINTQSFNTSISVPVTGTGSLTIADTVGGGSVTLTSGSSNYSGGTTITGGTLLAGATNALSPNSAINISGGTLNVSGYVNTIPSLIVGSSGTLDLGYGNVLTDTGTASFAGYLNLTGTPAAGVLMTYTSETGTFPPANVTGVPAGDSLAYNSSALVLVVVSTGPSTIYWTGAVSSAWDTSTQNWNTATGTPTTYSNTSNPSLSAGDNVVFNDSSNYNVSINVIVNPTSTTVNNSSGIYNFNGSAGIAGPGALLKLGSSGLSLYTSNSYTGGTNIAAGTLSLYATHALPSFGNVSIGSTAKLVATPVGSSSYPLQINSLSITSGGTLDLVNNSSIIRGTSFSTVYGLVQGAYANGGWTGSGITSSMAAGDTTHLTALGVIINDAGANTGGTTGTALDGTFSGANTSDGDVLVKYTYYGDANLNGLVDGSDYSLIDNGYLNHLTGWYNGDFNYDNIVNGSDYTLIDNAFNSQGSTIADLIASPLATATDQIAGLGTSSVPEPASLGLLAVGALGLLGRRNRRRV